MEEVAGELLEAFVDDMEVEPDMFCCFESFRDTELPKVTIDEVFCLFRLVSATVVRRPVVSVLEILFSAW